MPLHLEPVELSEKLQNYECDAYLTNAVKHFKHTVRGKRRIHQRPNAGEIEHCRWWLDLEREMVSPSVTLALGATAATPRMTVQPAVQFDTVIE